MIFSNLFAVALLVAVSSFCTPNDVFITVFFLVLGQLIEICEPLVQKKFDRSEEQQEA